MVAVPRFAWGTVARGGLPVVPVLLIAGMPCLFTPAGSIITTLTIAGVIDSRWWPNTGATHVSKIRAWLDPEGLEWTERLEPLSDQGVTVSSLRARIYDLELAATVAFQSQESLLRTAITAEVSPTETTAINVVDTTGFASSGTLYLNREAIDYAGVTATSFTTLTRARLGSRAQRHPFGTRGGEVLGSPDVTPSPQDVDGRIATLWAATLSADGTTITAVELEYLGVVGQGPVLDDGGAAYVLDADSVLKVLGQKLPAKTVTVGGYVHAGLNGETIRGMGASPSGGFGLAGAADVLPLTVTIGTTGSVGLVDRVVVLGESTTAGDPDRGGWHATRRDFLEHFNAAARTVAGLIGVGNTIALSLQSDGRLRVQCLFSSARDFGVFWPWNGPAPLSDHSITPLVALSSRPMPEAWVPILGSSRVYLSPDDYGVVPAVPSGLASGVTAYWALKLRSDAPGADREDVYWAKVTAKVASAPTYYLTVQGPGRYRLRSGAGVDSPVVQTVQDATLGLYVQAPDWVEALYALVVSVSSDLAEATPDAIDWDDLRTVMARESGGPLPPQRERYWEPESILQEMQNEARLNGLCLAVRKGLLTMVRVGEFAPTETTTATLVSADLALGDAIPKVDRGAGGIANTFELADPDRNAVYRAVDKTSLAHFGPGQTLKARLPPGATTLTLPQMAQAAYDLGARLLAAHRRPARTMSVRYTLQHAAPQLGDLVDVSLWAVPAQDGTRGITSRVAQVVGRAPRLFDDGYGGVGLTLRLQPQSVQGYAPSALIAAGGVSGAVVTLDTSTFGTKGFASPLLADGSTRTDGGASTFPVGSKVRLVEIDNASPLASTQHEVTAQSGATATLSPAPSAAFSALAASALKVMVIPDNYTISSLAQRPYAYLASSAGTIVAGVRARVFGS